MTKPLFDTTESNIPRVLAYIVFVALPGDGITKCYRDSEIMNDTPDAWERAKNRMMALCHRSDGPHFAWIETAWMLPFDLNRSRYCELPKPSEE